MRELLIVREIVAYNVRDGINDSYNLRDNIYNMRYICYDIM